MPPARPLTPCLTRRTGTAVLKMIDFDLSEIAPTLAPPAHNVFGPWPPLSTTRAASQSYCAPEVLAGVGPHDMFLADVWSLGVVLFTMVSGIFFVDVAVDLDPRFVLAQQAQLEGFSTVAAIYAMYNRPNPLSRPLVALLDRMLTINPAQRTTLDQIAAAPVGTCGPVHDVGPAPGPRDAHTTAQGLLNSWPCTPFCP